MSFTIFTILTTLTSAWNYVDKGPTTWHENYPECGSNYGSPINIPTEFPPDCDRYNATLNLNWDYTSENTDYVIRNNGKTLILEPILYQDFGIKTFDILNTNTHNIAKLPNIWYNTYESTDNKEYCLDSIHFHWGDTDLMGSEHTFDGKYAAFEAHFLHFSCDYNTLQDALKAYREGKNKDKYVLSAVGVLFELGEPNPAIEYMIRDEILKEVTKVGGTDNSTYKILNIRTSLRIPDLLPKNKAFVAYSGGITAPPCFETVRWNVLTHKLTISHAQLIKFRSLLTAVNTRPLTKNYRPIQNNTNKIYYCPLQVDELMITHENNSHILAIFIIAGSIIFFFICLIGVCRYNKRRKDKEFGDLHSLSTAGESGKDVSMKQVKRDGIYSVYQ